MGPTKTDKPFSFAFREWLPGVVAGLAPLLLFIFSGWINPVEEVKLPDAHPELVTNALEAHFLIFTIANTTVSLLSSVFKMTRLAGPRLAAAKSPKYLITFLVIVLLMAGGAYMALENGADNDTLTFAATALMFASIGPSFSIEFSLARIVIAQITPKPKSKPRSVPAG